MSKTKRVVAIKTIANKIAKASFYMLRDAVDFDVNKAFC
jgi:transposase